MKIIARFLTLSLITLVLSAPLYAEEPQRREPAFKDKEELSFVVSYRAALIPNMEAGEVVLRVNRTIVGTTPLYNITAHGKVFSHFRWFYELDDTYQTWLDECTLKPILFNFRIREGSYRVNCNYVYDWEDMNVTVNFHNLKRDPNPPVRVKLREESYDALALYYNLRSEDIANFTVGEVKHMELVLEDTVRRLSFKYLGRDQIKIKKLGEFRALKFSCSLASSSGHGFVDGSEFYIWISDDKNKIPLYLESPIKVGSVRATLTGYKNLKYPFDSKK